MSSKRKDSKGRVLRNGESQRADGRYMFRYTDAWGERQTVYSWKLVETDKIPEGKKCDKPLREIEKQIQQDIGDGIKTKDASNITVEDMFWSFINDRRDLKETSRCNYICLYNNHIKEKLGGRRIGAVKHSDIQRYYIDLLGEQGYSYNTAQLIQAILCQLFDIAVMDNIIRTNPTNKALQKAKRITNAEPKKRHALTEDEQARFIDFVYGSAVYKKWGNLFTVLLGTGLRIGEALGLRWQDCDFNNNTINVNHTLLYAPKAATMQYEYRISTPKTMSGVRVVPMFNDVKNALIKEREMQKQRSSKFAVDGYTDFIFLNRNGRVYTPASIFGTIQRITNAYNAMELSMAIQEGRQPKPLPQFSPHNLRHTFCTRLCENEQNIKIIQDIMGHSNIATTMDVYSEATMSKKQASFQSIEGKMKLV